MACGMTYDDDQKATKAHCRLAFSAQPQRFSLPLLVGLYSTKVGHAPSAKDVRTINFTFSFYLYLHLQPRKKCFFFFFFGLFCLKEKDK